jgi:anti-sigma factor ChrR (cupin superfamily)
MSQTISPYLNADLTQPAEANVDEIDWIPSPQPGVLRRPLDREGGEVARATSIVRFKRGHSFPAHVHGLGEEFLVIDGVFSDEHADFPAGTYVRNPPGTKHAPHSRDGCEMFVKLRQMRPEGESRVVLDTTTASWEPAESKGYTRIPLFEAEDGSEFVALESLEAGASTGARTLAGGEEVLLLEGDLEIEGEAFDARAWIRRPAGSSYPLSSREGCRFWVKRGHLVP